MSSRKKEKKFLKINTIFLMLVIIFTGIISSIPVHAKGSGFNNEVKQGVVVVAEYGKGTEFILDPNGEVYDGYSVDGVMYTGTGFFVGNDGENPQYLLTNHHVIEHFLETGKGDQGYFVIGTFDYQGITFTDVFQGTMELRVYYSEDDYDEAFVVDYYENENDADCALLRLNKATDKREPLTLMVPDEDMVGESVYAVGYPGISENVFTSASKWDIGDVTVSDGTVSRLATASGNGVNRIQMTAEINHGNSGGPLVTDGDGYVIGMNTNGISDYSGGNLYYAVNISHAISLLNRNNIPYTTAADKKGGISGVAVAVIVVIVILLAAAVVIFVVMKNKKKGQSGSASKSINSSGTKAVIRSMSTQHGGQAFPVGNAPVIIGRSPSDCTIVFKEGTPGVSGKHCSVYYNSDANVFTLTDLGSSYGTFLGNGMKLTANSPINLKPGDIFYIGEKTNILKVEVGQ